MAEQVKRGVAAASQGLNKKLGIAESGEEGKEGVGYRGVAGELGHRNQS